MTWLKRSNYNTQDDWKMFLFFCMALFKLGHAMRWPKMRLIINSKCFASTHKLQFKRKLPSQEKATAYVNRNKQNANQ